MKMFAQSTYFPISRDKWAPYNASKWQSVMNLDMSFCFLIILDSQNQETGRTRKSVAKTPAKSWNRSGAGTGCSGFI